MNLSDTDAYALRRVCVGLPIDDVGASAGVAMLLKSIGGDVPRLITLLGEVGLLERVMKFDPNAPAPANRHNQVYVPALPDYAQLSDKADNQSKQVGKWWRDTVEWGISRSPMTPHLFFKTGVAWLISLAIARRVCIDLHERIYPHLYLLWVAETSRFAKSTGLNTLYNIVHETMPHMLIPAKTSPEGMIEMLSGQEPANFSKLGEDDKRLIQKGMQYASQRGFIEDEISGILGANKKDYMQGFIELIMRLYDARPAETYYTRTGGLILVKQPALSIMGATTPSAMARAVHLDDWENGALARYLIAYREGMLPYNPNYSPIMPPKEIVKPLEKLHNYDQLPAIKTESGGYTPDWKPMTVSMNEDALKAYDGYTRAVMFDMLGDLDERLLGNYRRLHIQALKIALALAVMDWSMGVFGDKLRPEITAGHWAIAQTMTETSRHGLHRLMPILSESRDSRTQRDIITILKQHPAGVTIRDMVRLSGKATKDVKSAIEVLRESGHVKDISISGETGRPTSIYMLTGSGV